MKSDVRVPSPHSEAFAKRGASLMRLRGLIRKEFLQIVRDPSSIGIAFLMPVVLLLLFGYGVSLDTENVPIALVVEQPSADTSSLIGSFEASRYFKPVFMRSMHEAEQAMRERRVDGIVRLREDFAHGLRSGEGAPIQLIVNGVDANTARLVQGYVEGAVDVWLQQRTAAQGSAMHGGVEIEPRIWFNPELRSRNYLVPGLIAVIMTLIGALLTAMVVAREWERGTMEALIVTPVSIREILLGKLIPYFCLGMGGMTLSVGMAYFLFQVHLRGSFWVLFGASALFLLAALGMGLLISISAKNQFVAGQIALVATFLPAFLLSGFIFDIASMPTIVQAITHVIAARYYVAILQTVFLAGDIWRVIVPNALALVAMAAIFIGLSRKKAHKRLE